MYVIFKVPPFHKNIARAIQKTPKFYFYDTGQAIQVLNWKILLPAPFKKKSIFEKIVSEKQKNFII